ncbi:IS1182 family transposase [Methylosinus sp. H3A]|uniref:IS1182 family transposase n=1 Tax=Methylosinus sp. H3A TaxID=2785786 RepID=UPI0018C30F3B|nr:IS1182 family transposase [Methylosinus sp. H3A]MBG0808152.1 IS1182 family transposase [Methylosinus sp. H3A]
MTHIPGSDRSQLLLLPEAIDDYVSDDNPVRFVDAFVDALDLKAAGFARVEAKATGRPGYAPGDLLKLYIYGYLNRIQSSRRLEREANRNIELMWLIGRLAPDFKTIADFRRDNGPAIRAACAQFMGLCRQFDLFTRAVVAIDGSKFKAVNNRDKNFTVNKVAKRIEQVEASIARYLSALDQADRQDNDLAKAKAPRLKEKIEGLRRQMQSLKEMEKQVETAPDKQVSLTDPDARSMATSGKGTGVVGYNVQIAVDAEHHLIVAHEVINDGTDRAQLAFMGRKALEAIEGEEVTVLADRGYYSGEEVLACEGTGVLPRVPKTMTSGKDKLGFFTIRDFIYDADNDNYICPAGERLTKGKARSDRQDNIDHYRNLTACSSCALKHKCTPMKHKRVKRWEHEDVLDKMQTALDRMPDAMTIRRQTVEHPFGTLKAWMGSTHFLTRTLGKVKTEMSLQVLAYNMKRMINIVGIKSLMGAITA